MCRSACLKAAAEAAVGVLLIDSGVLVNNLRMVVL